MARPLRIEFAGALYHVTARGDRGEPIFRCDSDRRLFLGVADQAMDRFSAVAFAYCLMGNHYHFVLRTDKPNLSRLMHYINGVYTQAFNRAHGLSGHVLQGRFGAILVDRDTYFLAACRYVDLNPVRAGLVEHPGDWPWSSYRAHSGQASTPRWLDSEALYGQLDAEATQGPQAYARFVAAGSGVRLWDEALTGQIYLGTPNFARKMQSVAKASRDREIPKQQRLPVPRPLAWYLGRYDRDAAIAKAYLSGEHTQAAIARATGLSVSRISRLIATFEARGKT